MLYFNHVSRFIQMLSQITVSSYHMALESTSENVEAPTSLSHPPGGDIARDKHVTGIAVVVVIDFASCTLGCCSCIYVAISHLLTV